MATNNKTCHYCNNEHGQNFETVCPIADTGLYSLQNNKETFFALDLVIKKTKFKKEAPTINEGALYFNSIPNFGGTQMKF